MENDPEGDRNSSPTKFERISDLSESQMKLILQNISELVFLLDSNMRILWANAAALKWINKAEDEVVGKRRFEVMGREFPRVECPVQKAVKNGRFCATDVVVNGVAWSMKTYPVLDELNEIIGVIEISEDVTGKRETDIELRNLVETVNDGVWRWRLDTGEVEWSGRAYAILGYGQDELDMSVEQWKSMLHPDDLENSVRTELEGINGPDGSFSVEFRLRTRDGSWRWILSRGKVIRRTSDGSPLIVVGTHVDIDERKEYEVSLKRSRDDLIRLMSRSVAVKDPYTHEHQQRVAALSKRIATSMGLSEDQVEAVEMAAMLHDIGKFVVPSEILVKTGRLSELEISLIRSHAGSGYEILKDVNFGKPIAEIVLQHHERLDGSGYPNGIKDDEMLLEAKIIAVADVVEAMSSHRPYRAALGIDAALDEIKKNSGRLYDTEVADHCLKVMEEGFTF